MSDRFGFRKVKLALERLNGKFNSRVEYSGHVESFQHLNFLITDNNLSSG